LRSFALDAHRLLVGMPAAAASLRQALRWASEHTGLPAILLAAIALATSRHFFKQTVRFVVEVAVALGLLLAATRLGWIVW
jgi:hypothetical protein